MAVQKDAIRYVCDWRDENDESCGFEQTFTGDAHSDAARKAGWASYANAYVRRAYWGRGAKVWFCPRHATVFGNNHGWGGLESYEPPMPTRRARRWFR